MIPKHPRVRCSFLENAKASRRRRQSVERSVSKEDQSRIRLMLLPTRLAICEKTGRLLWPVGRRPADSGGSLLISFGRGSPRDGPFITVSLTERAAVTRFYARGHTFRLVVSDTFLFLSLRMSVRRNRGVRGEANL